MKITKQKLEKIVREAAADYVYGVKNPARVANKYKLTAAKKVIKEDKAVVSQDKIDDAVMAILSAEGGAAGMGPIKDALKALEDDNTKLPDKSMEDLIGNVAGVVRHADGDYIDSTQLKEIVKEALSERCQKGYKTHPTRKTKKMYGKTYRNCIKAEGNKLSESIDVDTIENLENAIKVAYDEMTVPTDVDQTYAGSGEPVSKYPQDMHDKAVEFLMSVVKDVASGEMLSSPRTLNEDGHSDVPSAVRAMKTIIEDAAQMLQALEQMGDNSLPTWWTNKMAVSANMMNKMRDYLLVQSDSMEEKKLTKPEKKEKEKVVKGMKKNKADFEDRYGEDAESVMYATATKIAKEKA